jgi:hypothetical protein
MSCLSSSRITRSRPSICATRLIESRIVSFMTVAELDRRALGARGEGQRVRLRACVPLLTQGMPYTLPLGEVPGVFVSVWASIQMSPDRRNLLLGEGALHRVGEALSGECNPGQVLGARRSFRLATHVGVMHDVVVRGRGATDEFIATGAGGGAARFETEQADSR